MGSADTLGFLTRVGNAADLVSSWIAEGAYIMVFTHNDADALSSAGIIGGALKREDAVFKIRSIPRIEYFLQLLDEGYVDSQHLIFTDLGSGYLHELIQRIEDKTVVILDHHSPVNVEIPSGWIHVNPHEFGFNGATDISASGVAYLFAKSLNEENIIYSPIAVVGALGDLQDKNEKRALDGLNKLIVDDAVNTGLLAMQEDFIIYGRGFKPIHVALASTTSPYIPGLSGQEGNCYQFLIDIGVEPKRNGSWRTLAELSQDEKKRLYNGLIQYLTSRGLPVNVVNELVGTVYELVKEEPWTSLRDAREFATLLNACGKTGNAWVGIAIAMGERGEILETGQKLLEEYRNQLARSIEYVTKEEAIEEMNNIVVLKGGDVIDEKQISSVASILSSSNMLPSNKPLIAIANAGEFVKISARATRELVERGLDLGAVLSKLAPRFGGRGGGHNIAAGAEVPAKRLIVFLAELDRAVGESLAAGS